MPLASQFLYKQMFVSQPGPAWGGDLHVDPRIPGLVSSTVTEGQSTVQAHLRLQFLHSFLQVRQRGKSSCVLMSQLEEGSDKLSSSTLQYFQAGPCRMPNHRCSLQNPSKVHIVFNLQQQELIKNHSRFSNQIRVSPVTEPVLLTPLGRQRVKKPPRNCVSQIRDSLSSVPLLWSGNNN